MNQCRLLDTDRRISDILLIDENWAWPFHIYERLFRYLQIRSEQVEYVNSRIDEKPIFREAV